MYTFEDKGGRSLTLRPEATAPIARAYLEHGLHREAQPVKLYTIASMYRYSAPQRGRYREHWQLSVEAIGSDDPAVDAEVIQLYDELLARLGVTNYELLLNSIGDENCRPAYLEKLTAWLDEHDDVLDDEARQKRATSPLRVFDVKNERVQAALADAPKIGDSLCDECRAHFEAVQAHLENYAVKFTLVADAGARDRLLHAHGVRVRRRGDRRQELDLRRRPLRRPDRAARRQADARDRLRRRDRAAAALARGGGRDAEPAGARRLRRARRRRPTSRACCRSSRSCAAAG